MADTYVSQDYIDCGFFNAVEITPGVYDRVYSAETMSNPYDRIITDGIFTAREGTDDADFKVISDEDMDIIIKVGSGIFWGKWFKLTQAQTLTLENNDSEYSRIDSIIIEINNTAREGRVIYRTGTPAAEPEAPALLNTGYIKEWRIANILVPSYATSIDDSNIFDRRGIETPFVTSLVQTLSTQELFTQWDQLYSNYFAQTKAKIAAFLRELTEELNVSMSIQEVVANTTLAEAGTTVNLTNFNSLDDIIFVIVNGVIADSTRYTINSAGSLITFTDTLDAGTVVTTRILKSVKAPLPCEEVGF